jgi:glycosyltransferase involved in cell wall biosynthesis
MSEAGVAGPPRTIGIVADLTYGLGGGVNAFARSMVRALADASTEHRFVVFVAESEEEWVPVADTVKAVAVRRYEAPMGLAKWGERARRYGAVVGALARGDLARARYTRRRRSRQEALRGALARTPWRLDIVHFPFQDFVETTVPMIFSPWDLQHLHLEDLWPRSVAAERDAYYRRGCALASTVVLASRWARDDVVERYGIPEGQTVVVPVAAPTTLQEEPTPELCAGVAARYELPERFVFYPASTWPHKNHRGLISAMGEVNRRTGLGLDLVLCGPAGRNRGELLDHAREVGMSGRVHFLGFVPDGEIRALYRMALLCAFPSLFEGAGLPVLEAFQEGCPLVASRVTCIPEYAGDAAVLFDPRSVADMADALQAVATSEHLRRQLVSQGRERAREYSWSRVASDFLSLYDRLAPDSGPSTPAGRASTP